MAKVVDLEARLNDHTPTAIFSRWTLSWAIAMTVAANQKPCPRIEQEALLPHKLSSLLFVVEWHPSAKLHDLPIETVVRSSPRSLAQYSGVRIVPRQISGFLKLGFLECESLSPLMPPSV